MELTQGNLQASVQASVKIFCISDGYLVDKINEFGAIGAGQDYALTAMYLDKTPEEAVEIANELCVYCSPPINVITKEISDI